ncbi:MAG TPA: 5-formyltetrahydrofolate cyclo-ligase [Frankiaceae bacterium]|nr:5-formyltetrahydrofolate cyclo-ligase [Frankiaceae bacterium]
MDVPGGENDVRSAKQRLRARALLRRQLMSDSARAAAAASIADRVLALPEVASARVVAAYVGTGTELPTRPLLDALTARGVRVLLPVLLPDDALAWGAYDGTLVEGRRGLLEPPGRDESLASADLVIVPGVAYDLAWRRLGRGGGSYDRALAPVTVPVLALALDTEVVDEVPVEAHDRAVDVIVTPTRVVRVRR